jgi:hypothetical protein
MNRNNTNIATGNEPEFRTNYWTYKCHTWTKFDYIHSAHFLKMSKASHTLFWPKTTTVRGSHQLEFS